MIALRTFAFLVSGLILTLAAGASSAADAITVVAAFNLSGPQAVLDLPSFQGAQLAVEQRNAAGGVLGRPLQLVPVDTQSRSETAADAVAAQLKAQPSAVAGIGYSDSTFALDVGRVFQAAGRPFVTSGATAPDLPEQAGNQMFLAAYGDDAQAQVMAAYAHDTLKAKTVALWIDEGFIYTRTVGHFFDSAFRKLGGSVDRKTYVADLRDFSTLIAEFKAADPQPQAIYAASMPRTAVTLIEQVRDAGIDVPLLSGDGWDDADIVEFSKRKAIAGIFFTTHRFLGVDTPEMKAFVAAYTAKFGAPPPNAFAPLGYDTVNLLADAIGRAGSADPDAVRTALAATSAFPGVVGIITYTAGRHVPEKEVSVIGLDKGILAPVWTGRP